MAIHWYPGHMHKANKDMTEVLANVDIVIELLDARIPYSSQNPNIARLRANKPCIKILSKSDLADPAITKLWQAHFEQDQDVQTLLTTLNQSDKAQKVTSLCHKLMPGKVKSNLQMLVMVAGIPNVGKSTLINALASRKVTKTGDEPAITKGQQRIKLEDKNITLLDTPGILWPKIHNVNSGYRLAATGAIKETATDALDLAMYVADYLLKHNPQVLLKRYGLKSTPETEVEFLEMMGAKRGCLRSGGRVELDQASSIFIKEFRAGILGGISLETPDMIALEEIEVKRLQEEKAERDKLRKVRGKARLKQVDNRHGKG
ncbi:MAG: ribosome biogenesis GTPase A [Patiriisocius sp.]|jgi:ribosome biogenesis GTPase A